MIIDFVLAASVDRGQSSTIFDTGFSVPSAGLSQSKSIALAIRHGGFFKLLSDVH